MLKKFKRKLSLILTIVMIITLIPGTSLTVRAESGSTTKVGNDVTSGKKPVVKISKIDDINKTVNIKSAFSMPATVTATMSDNTKKAFAVKWDKKLTTAKKGIFKAYGTVIGYNKKVVLTLNVNEIKMGTIEIPKVTDSSLKKPSDLKLSVRKVTEYYGSDLMTIDQTLPSIVWTQNAPEADFYLICVYDQYKQQKIKTTYCIGGNDVSKPGYFDLSVEEAFNIGTITVTPINSVDGSAGGGAKSNDKIGETAVFECSVEVTEKEGKKMILKATPTEWDPDRMNLMLSEKIAPYAYYTINTAYQITDKYGKHDESSGTGGHAEKDGSILISSVKGDEYKERYANPTAKIQLMVYSDATVVSDTKASFVINIYDVVCDDKTVIPK